jgi:MFS family permease
MLRDVLDDGAHDAPQGPLGLLKNNSRMRRLTAAVLVSAIGDPFSQAVSLVLLYQATRTPLAIAAAYGVEMLGTLTVGSLIGAAADRVDRRRLIVGLEIIRLLVVASLPLVTGISVFLLYPFLCVLASIEAVVQPARQAAVPELVSPEEVNSANALLMTALTLAQAVGFAIAGAALISLSNARMLYFADAATFGVAAVLVATVTGMGGGLATARLRGGVLQAWSVPGGRSLLIVAAATVLFVGMLNPAMLPVAYALSPNGATAFTMLESCLITGGFIGSLIAGRIGRRRRLPAQAFSLWVFGAGVSLAGTGHSVLITGLAVALGAVGNAIYSITNTSGIMDLAVTSNRGSVMSARFTVTRVSMALGLAGGAALTGWFGPLKAFSSVGLGLLSVAAGYSLFLLAMRCGASTHEESRHAVSRDEGDPRESVGN